MERKINNSDSKRNKYNRHLKFIVHPESKYHDGKPYLFYKIILFSFIWHFYLRMATNVPTGGLLLGASAGVALSWIYLRYFEMRRVLRGFGEAYFKRSYKKSLITIEHLDYLAAGGIGITTANLLYFTHRMNVEGSLAPIWKLIFNFNPIFVAVGAAIGYAIYFINFKIDKYVSVREYSNLYHFYKKGGISNPQTLHRMVLEQKDKDNNIFEFDGSYFDEKELVEEDDDYEIRRTGRGE